MEFNYRFPKCNEDQKIISNEGPTSISQGKVKSKKIGGFFGSFREGAAYIC